MDFVVTRALASTFEQVQPFANRLEKRLRHLSRWARRSHTSAFRLYDRDMPEFPFTVDWFDGRILLVEYPRHSRRRETERVVDAISTRLQVARADIHFRVHEPKRWGHEQYEKVDEDGTDFAVEESGLRFWVNLSRYLDSGLFLDHRMTRAMVRKEAHNKRMLNLFAYTGSFSVYAAVGGAVTTVSVDLSKGYLAWAERNFRLNGISTRRHEFIRADVRQWLASHSTIEPFDLIVLDPPSFSTSKAMNGTFNIQRDYRHLLELTIRCLSPEGTLFFSTNFQKFELDDAAIAGLGLRAEDITALTLPVDFRNRRIHQCWRVHRA